MQRIIRWVIAVGLVALPLAAQQNIAIVSQAQQALALADASGAQIYAKSLYDDAAYRIRFAQDNINSTRASMQARASSNSDVADYQAYIAEMIARRAYYMARFNEASRSLPDIQLQRTRLAQTYSDRQASLELAQREEVERRTADLQRQLAAEQANRQAQAEELERLRSQIDENRRAMQSRIESDRAARIDAETRLDEAMRQYEAAAISGNSADLDRLRRNVEDQQIALRTVQERERLDSQALSAEIDAARNDANQQADLTQRQSQLDQYQRELQSDINARAEIQRPHE